VSPLRLVLSCASLGAIVLGSLPGVAAAQEGPPLELSSAVQQALDSNPNLAVVAEMIPQARASRDRAFAMVQPQLSLGLQYRINDREIAFDPAEGFGDGGLTEAFEGLYGNLGVIYGQLFEEGMIDADDCLEIALANGFDSCDELTELFLSGEEIEAPDTGGDTTMEPIVIQQKEQLYVNIDAMWPVNPRVVPLARAGSHQVDAARAQVAQTKEQVIGAVVQTYAMAFQAQEAGRVMEAQVELARAHQRDTEVLLAAGVVTEDAVRRARVQVARIELQLTQLRRQEATARRALGLLTGAELSPGPLAGLSAAEVTAVDLEQARTDARRRPDRAAAASQAEAAREMQIDAGMQFLPTFAVSGQWNWSDASSGFDDRQSSWFIGLGASLPIWDGGLLVHGAREAASRRRQAVAQLDALTDQVDVEVLDAHGNWLAAVEALPVAEAERALAEETYRLVQVRYAAGQARQIEVLDALAALQQAELSVLNQQVQVQVQSVALLQATGQLRTWAASL